MQRSPKSDFRCILDLGADGRDLTACNDRPSQTSVASPVGRSIRQTRATGLQRSPKSDFRCIPNSCGCDYGTTPSCNDRPSQTSVASILRADKVPGVGACNDRPSQTSVASVDVFPRCCFVSRACNDRPSQTSVASSRASVHRYGQRFLATIAQVRLPLHLFC